MYRNSLLFDDVASANAYRKVVLARRGPGHSPGPPVIYTRDGHRIGSDGLLNPKSGAGRVPETLPFVFGASPEDSHLFTQELEQLMAGEGPTCWSSVLANGLYCTVCLC